MKKKRKKKKKILIPEGDVCPNCGKRFPPAIMSPMYINGEYTPPLCGICARKIRNKIHGLPEDTPFQGETAQWMEEQANEYLSTHGR